jgi:electron transport complex protein RnfA
VSANLLSLFVLSGLSLNLIFQFAFAINGVYTGLGSPIRNLTFQCVLIFITDLVLFLVFTLILNPLALGFVKYFLLFPLCALVLYALDVFIPKIIHVEVSAGKKDPFFSSFCGLAIAASLITLQLASSFTEAFVLSFGFSAGSFFAFVVLRAVYNRVIIEKKPRMMRGIPLMLVSMGLLSLIFTSTAIILLNGLFN